MRDLRHRKGSSPLGKPLKILSWAYRCLEERQGFLEGSYENLLRCSSTVPIQAIPKGSLRNFGVVSRTFRFFRDALGFLRELVGGWRVLWWTFQFQQCRVKAVCQVRRRFDFGLCVPYFNFFLKMHFSQDVITFFADAMGGFGYAPGVSFTCGFRHIFFTIATWETLCKSTCH